nr:hypothetical protein Iba_chr02dCG8660 [Ipomoea batatas]
MAADENEFCHQEHMVAQTLHRIDFDHQLPLKRALHYLACPLAPSHAWSHEPNHQMAHWPETSSATSRVLESESNRVGGLDISATRGFSEESAVPPRLAFSSLI